MEHDSSDDQQYASGSDEGDIYIDQSHTAQTALEYISTYTLQSFPHNAIGAITFKHHTIKSKYIPNGTGFLVASNLVLTVAHSIFDKKDKLFFLDIMFFPSLYGPLANPIRVVDWRLPEQFTNLPKDIIFKKKGVKYDYALLKLESDVKLPQYFTMVNKFNNDYQKISIFGYPAFIKDQDELIGQQAGSQGDQCTSIIKIDPKTMRLKHCLSSQPGHSGSPILLENNQVIAIHKSGIQGRGCNCGVLVNSQMIANIQKWEYELNKGKKVKIAIKEYLKQRSLEHSRQLMQTSRQRPNLTRIKPIDERKYKSLPFNCIGQILVEYQGEKDKGGANTAFLISENLILTCFSSIYNPYFEKSNTNAPSPQLFFVPSFQIGRKQKIAIECYKYNKEEFQLGRQKCKGKPKTFELLLQDLYFDFCLLKLKEKVILPEYLQLLVDFDYNQAQFELYGCPSQDSFGQQIQNVKLQGTESIEMDIYMDKHMISHNVDTRHGMVGSPLLVLQNKVIGIHKFRLKNQVNCKGARLVSIDMVEKLCQWNLQLKGTPFITKCYTDQGIVQAKSTKQLQKQHSTKKSLILQSRIDKT